MQKRSYDLKLKAPRLFGETGHERLYFDATKADAPDLGLVVAQRLVVQHRLPDEASHLRGNL
jgi:hypothetical protein